MVNRTERLVLPQPEVAAEALMSRASALWVQAPSAPMSMGSSCARCLGEANASQKNVSPTVQGV